MTNSIKNKYDFLMLFDVADGNPNGDPDAGNLPRVDAETGMGLVTDVCLKRKIRNYVQLVKNLSPRFDIFVKEKAILNNEIDKAHEQPSVKDKEKGEKTAAARDWMCGNYYDIRTFGAVMSVGKNAGQVRGPVQLTFARSIDPIVYSEHTITRIAVTTQKEAEKQGGENHTMGRKSTVPYGLYKACGFISANLAAQTGFSEEDLSLFWDAVKNMFENDRSASHGLMSMRKLFVFKHDSEIGNAPSHELFGLVKIARKNPASPARSFDDYEVSIDEESVPSGVQIIKML